MEKAILVDLDGTLADVEHRVHHVQKEKKNWKAFNEGMVHDELNHWCADLIKAMQGEGYKTIFITGRSEPWRGATEEWLKKHSISFDHLYMRPSKDRREDFEVKKEIYLNEIKDDYQVVFVVEDRASVVKMWREVGLVCLQCDWGDF
jgi:FMN phosphatase YigB (HAD superfamily)